MKRKLTALLLAMCLFLTGCGWLDGSYVSVTPHREQRQETMEEVISAADQQELIAALKDMVSTGTESGVINVAEYPQKSVEIGMDLAVAYIRRSDPVGAYAVEDISYELGTNSGLPAIAVTVSYRHSSMEIRMIRRLADMDAAKEAVGQILESYEASAVLLVEHYHQTDFSQLVQDYAESHPDKVMETPQVSAGIYGNGKARVVALTFTYQTSRDSLRQMQSQVQPVFNAAALYVSGDGAEKQKFSQLYAFLMERFDYTLETSITPAYSLLRHGVGDSRAFATVYAAMCRGAGLECITVTGTRDGEPWTWNIILDDGHYFHVDLLRCNESGVFRESTDGEMHGYVWDYSAYPECPEIYVPVPEEGAPSRQEPAETAGEETVEQSEPETEPVFTEPEEEEPQETAENTLPTEILEN